MPNRFFYPSFMLQCQWYTVVCEVKPKSETNMGQNLCFQCVLTNKYTYGLYCHYSSFKRHVQSNKQTIFMYALLNQKSKHKIDTGKE